MASIWQSSAWWPLSAWWPSSSKEAREHDIGLLGLVLRNHVACTLDGGVGHWVWLAVGGKVASYLLIDTPANPIVL
jgi:hypothetical protein